MACEPKELRDALAGLLGVIESIRDRDPQGIELRHMQSVLRQSKAVAGAYRALGMADPQVAAAIEESRNEAAWERQQQSLMESGGPDDSSYRRDMIDAGRGHLLR